MNGVMRMVRLVMTVVLSPIWVSCFLLAMATGFLFLLAFAIANQACPPAFVREWADHLFG